MAKQQDFARFNESEMEYFEDVHLSKFSPKQSSQKTPAKAASGIIIYEPMHPEDVQALIDRLRLNESAIVNLEKPAGRVAQRILDLLAGAVYALGGNLSVIKPDAKIFLLTPSGMAISTSFHD